MHFNSSSSKMLRFFSLSYLTSISSFFLLYYSIILLKKIKFFRFWCLLSKYNNNNNNNNKSFHLYAHAECFRFLNQLVCIKVLSQVDFSCAKLKEKSFFLCCCWLLQIELQIKSGGRHFVLTWIYEIEIWRLNK